LPDTVVGNAMARCHCADRREAGLCGLPAAQFAQTSVSCLQLESSLVEAGVVAG
jgi:hypothetical protein